MKKEFWWGRDRDFKTLDSRFENKISKFISSLNNKISILEIGFGEGKALLEVIQNFRDKHLKCYGINLKPECGVKKRIDLLKNAKKFKISIERSKIPIIYFYDTGEGLKFRDNSFDIIMSQVAFPYVPDKAKLIEEIWRVLKPNGKVFIHIDNARNFDSFPDFLKQNEETPRFIIYDNKKIIKLSEIIKELQRKGFDISLWFDKNKPAQRHLIITKNKNVPLKLNLKLDNVSTFDLTIHSIDSDFNRVDKYKNGENGWWGTRSFFYLK